MGANYLILARGRSSRNLSRTRWGWDLKKQNCRASAILWGSSVRPSAVVRAGTSLCLHPKHHLAVVHRCSGEALWRNSFAQWCLASWTTLMRVLCNCFHVSGLGASQTAATALLHSSSHQAAALGENTFCFLKTAWQVSLVSCVRQLAAWSIRVVEDSSEGA
jgi:hypothetical protein